MLAPLSCLKNSIFRQENGGIRDGFCCSHIRHMILAPCQKWPVRFINLIITTFVGKLVNIMLIDPIKINILLGIKFP